ncbi:uncharacterized protein M6B38_180715 [Iris pallida]|uniref:DUF569 domain-containing protein n=1 Tax=Iris pallida TaxID=29817 RepID=A0AAX6EN46_IRIPA|nr:uncharacterized protein M6B38_180715 [Iris pallida]
MEHFRSAKVVRLRSHHDKYLLADDDEEHVLQERNAAGHKASRWSVEPSPSSPSVIRLKSCFGRYLTASSEPFLLGMTGRKVLQTLPSRLDSSVEWEPVREGFQVRLKTRYGHFLRANGGLPPWRNSVTHDIPHRTSTQDWVLWDVEIVEIRTDAEGSGRWGDDPDRPLPPPPPPPPMMGRVDSDSVSVDESFDGSPHKSDGRTIYYVIAEDNGSVDNSEEHSFSFKGTSVAELTEKLEEETGLSGIIVCTKNPLNGQLCPLCLHLPPNSSTVHVVVVQASSKVAKTFNRPQNPL